MCDCTRVGVARAVLWEIAAHRQRIHRARWDAGPLCDVEVVVAGVSLVEVGRLRAIAATGRPLKPCLDCGRPAAEQPPGARLADQRFYVGGSCPCLQMLVDVLLTAHRFLMDRGAAIRHPEGAARRHVGSRQHDYPRQRRGEMGAQVRTDRLPTSARAQQLETDEQRLLLQDVADEAGSESPLEGQVQLELRLAMLRARRLGVDIESVLAEVRRDLAVVKAHYSSGRLVNVGTSDQPEMVSWWETYIERPLGRRPRVSDIPAVTAPNCLDDGARSGLELPCPSSEVGYQRVIDELSSDPDDTVLMELRRTAVSEPQGDRGRQLEATLRRLAQEGKILTCVVESFLASPARRSRAVEAFDEVLIGSC
jgi:hypothetical protein